MKDKGVVGMWTLLRFLRFICESPVWVPRVHKSGMTCPEKDSCTNQRVNKPLVYVWPLCCHPKKSLC